jgi:hypothetical protein
MAKVGRNDPCSCGSGKKYKKCCLEKDEAAGTEHELPEALRPDLEPPEDDADGQGGIDIHPYVIAKWCDDPEVMERVKRGRDRRGAGKMRYMWTPSKLATMNTEEIERRLQELGVEPSRERFLDTAKYYTSAWELSEVWRLEVPEDRFDSAADDFVGIAACELWKRHCPERPSVEMLDDWMQDGYVPYAAHRYAEASDVWRRLWAVVSERLTPEMTDFEDADKLVAGTQSVGNWIQDFVLALRNAACNDDVKYAEQGIAVLERSLGQFTEQDRYGRIVDVTDLAFLHYRLGHEEIGERILLGVIEEFPERASGYACLSDELAERRPGEDRPRDLSRAIVLLEQALARPVDDADDWDLERRLEDLREQKGAGS